MIYVSAKLVLAMRDTTNILTSHEHHDSSNHQQPNCFFNSFFGKQRRNHQSDKHLKILLNMMLLQTTVKYFHLELDSNQCLFM